jgi:hypothetical protein
LEDFGIGSSVKTISGENAHLLMRNQMMRFKLVAARAKIARIEQLLFGTSDGELDQMLPPDLVPSYSRAFSRPGASSGTRKLLART